jgi:hypothetical protein
MSHRHCLLSCSRSSVSITGVARLAALLLLLLLADAVPRSLAVGSPAGLAPFPAHWLRTVGGGVPISSIAAVQRQWPAAPLHAPLHSATDAEASDRQCSVAEWSSLLLDGCEAELSDAMFVVTTPLLLYASTVNAIGLTVVSRSNHSVQTAYNLSDALLPGYVFDPAIAVHLLYNATLNTPQLHVYVAYTDAMSLTVNRYLYDAASDAFQLLASYQVDVDDVDNIRMALDVRHRAEQATDHSLPLAGRRAVCTGGQPNARPSLHRAADARPPRPAQPQQRAGHRLLRAACVASKVQPGGCYAV